MYNSDRDKLIIILGYQYEMGRFDGHPGNPGIKAVEVERGLRELAEFLNIEFDDNDDIVSICGMCLLPGNEEWDE